MVIIDEETGTRVPCVYTVCDCCQGRGTHTNPSIDSNGLSDEMLEDEDAMESYRRGVFDVPCAHCKGLRVVLIPADPESKEAALLQHAWRCEAEYAAEIAAERRMGC